MMSNKYKHSWKRIESLDIWSIPFSTPSSNWGEYIKCGEDTEAGYQISEDLDLIKELVNKETPMKKTIKNGRPYCAKCSYSLLIEDVWEMSYCCACGQRVLWD